MYSTPNDMRLLISERELVQMAGESRSRSWESDDVQAALLEAIDQADGEIDGYIGMAVQLPLENVPRIITNLSAKLAVYNIIRRRRDEIPPSWQAEYKHCISMLKSLADGTLKLAAGVDAPAEEQSGPVVVNTRPPKFDADTWEKF